MAIWKNKQENVKDLPHIEIELVQTILKQGQIINRQVNKKDIEASLVNGEFIVKNYKDTELSTFIIFYFDKSETKKMMTLAEIKT